MKKEKMEALKAAGFRSGSVADFLELTPEEISIVELRVAISQATRRRREEQNLTQQQLATRIKSSQPRVAKIEAGASDVSLDLMFRGFFAVGGKVAELARPRVR